MDAHGFWYGDDCLHKMWDKGAAALQDSSAVGLDMCVIFLSSSSLVYPLYSPFRLSFNPWQPGDSLGAVAGISMWNSEPDPWQNPSSSTTYHQPESYTEQLSEDNLARIANGIMPLPPSFEEA